MVLVEGSALNTQGFLAYNTTEGLGLNTFGFLWPEDGIWSLASDPIGTMWIQVGLQEVQLETLTVNGSVTL
jgi:hypothetical protein